MIKSFIVLLCSILLLPVFSGAEEVETLAEPDITEVVEVVGNVPVERSVQTVSVLGKKKFRELGARNLKNVLSAVPGVLSLSNGKFGQTASTYIRGANTTQVLYLIDGIKVRDVSNIGGISLATISPFLVDKVEIVRGPLSSLYGSDAMGGVISISTGMKEGLNFETSLGSHGSYQGNVSWSKTFGDLLLSIGSANQFYTDNVENDNFKNNGIKFSLDYRGSDLFHTGFKFFANITHAGIPFNMQAPTPEREYSQFNYTAAVPVSFKFNNQAELRINFSMNRNDYEFNDPQDLWSPYSKNVSDNQEIEASFRSVILDSFTLSAGVDYASQSILTEDNFGITIDNLKSNYFSSFVLLNFQRGDFFLTGSLRFDKYKDVDSNLSPQIGFSYLIQDTVKLRGSYAESFKAPLPVHQINPWGTSNFNLEPEKGKSVEAGIDLFLKNLRGGITWFSNDYSNLIDWVTVDWTTYSGQYQNISKAKIRGLEFEISWSPLKVLNIGYSHTYLDTKNLATDEALPRRPKNASIFTVSYSGRKFSLSGNLRYVGSRSDVDYTAWPPEVVNPAFNTYNLTGIIPVGKSVSLQLRFTNLMDKEYHEFYGYPSPGRRFELGITYNK